MIVHLYIAKLYSYLSLFLFWSWPAFINRDEIVQFEELTEGEIQNKFIVLDEKSRGDLAVTEPGIGEGSERVLEKT